MLERIFLVLTVPLLFGLMPMGAYEMSRDEFYSRIEQNSIPLIKSKAGFESNLAETRSNISWNASYVESDIDIGKSSGVNTIESTTLLILTPRLPWVVSMLKSSLNIKSVQYKKHYDLLKTLAFIGAKRLYLNYILTKEKYQIYQLREQNFLSQLEIAESRLKSGSIANKDYVNFKNSYYEAKLARTQTQHDIAFLKAELLKSLGLSGDGDIRVMDMEFGFVPNTPEELSKIWESSPYIEILGLGAQDEAIQARAAGASRWDGFEFGLGLQNISSADTQQNLASFRLQVPIPFTTKYGHLKRKHLILQSAILRELEVKKNNLKVEVLGFAQQLSIQQDYIRLQDESVQNKKSLMDMGKIAYESQKIGLFEYLTYQNSYMDSLIARLQSRLDYVKTQTLLEEALGMILTQGMGYE